MRQIRVWRKGTLNESLEIQPHDKVMFDGKKADVIAKNQDGTFTVLVDGMTVDCAKSHLEVIDKVDNMEAPMKFDPDTLKLLDEADTKCKVMFGDVLIAEGECSEAEWNRKHGKLLMEVSLPNGRVGLFEQQDITLVKENDK